MKVLLIGSGGREDALAWALARSPRLELLRCAPGNAGMATRGECVDLGAEDVGALVEHARLERYDLVVVGPEAPLVGGIADRLEDAGIPVCGPRASAARLEGSKVFAKELMARHGIPTASFRVFEDAAAARAFLRSSAADYPLVVKADGLASGKGVILCDDAEQALRAASDMLEGRRFGAAGARIVVEQRLVGREVSFFVLSDGAHFVELATCQDYKRALDGDRGLNTGGMGAYSPSAFIDEPCRREIVQRIVEPTLRGLAREGTPFSGVLFVGLMLTSHGPRVLEFNARFGDPETQALVPRLDGDWLELLHRAATGRLAGSSPQWKSESTVCVVMTARGYPGASDQGQPITGCDAAAALGDVVVYHAGTRRRGADLCTSAGRVLGVTGIGRDLAAARERAYEAVARIHWDGEHHRHDIALDAVERLAQGVNP